MSTLNELRRLLAQPQPTNGVVVRIDGATAKVATAHGLISAQATTRISPGDQVRVSQGVVYPRPVASGRYRL